jgi:hypothetical protein
MDTNDLDEPAHTTRELECALSDTEVRERGETMSRAERDMEKLKVRRRALNVQIRGLLDLMTEMSIAIDERKERRDVACTWLPDYKARTWSLRRDDLGTDVEVRPMSGADLQTDLLDGVDLLKLAAPSRPTKPLKRKRGR